MTHMTTVTGLKVNVFAFIEANFDILDVAVSLSRQCRFNGHTKGHLSVARHSINVSTLLATWGEPAAVQLGGLLHDAAEAYTGDIITPLKHHPDMKVLRDLDDKITKTIFCANNIGYLCDDMGVIKQADTVVYDHEATVVRFRTGGDPDDDQKVFLETFHRLKHKMVSEQALYDNGMKRKVDAS